MGEEAKQTWTIFRLSAKDLLYLGQINAPDEDKAIKIAIKEFQITNPYHQARLVARMVGS
jgi:hypothetical protein